jgi:hypothetical protein
MSSVCTFCAVTHGGEEFPPAEKAIQDDVDHWGQAFSDQLVAFRSGFARFEAESGKRNLDYVLGVETSLRKTFPNKHWFKGRFANVVELSAARNEAEAFQLAILPRMGFELNDVRLAVSDLTKVGERGRRGSIPARYVNLWRVGFVETLQPSYPTRHVGMWPDPLLELEPFTVKGVDLGPVWCEIKVPADASPGDYEGSITVSCANAHSLKLAVKLHVWDFALPPRVQMPMLVWTQALPREEARKYYSLLLEHQVDPVKAGANPKVEELSDDLEFCFKRGLMYFDAIDFKDPESFRPYYENIRRKGWLDKAIIYAAHDEPSREQFEEIVVPATQRLHRDFPGLKVYLASQ